MAIPRSLAVLLLLLLITPSSRGQQFQSIDVEPSVVEITGRNRQAQILITGQRQDQTLVDLTHQAKISITETNVATLSGSLVLGRREGQTSLQVSVNGFETTIPIIVRGYSDYPAISFEVDMIPLLTKLHCNSGGCHGRQGGQNGFQLSIFGFDPATDYEALTRQGRGRRVFPGAIEQSLIYSKATGLVAHGGGARMKADSQDAELLREWIHQGLPWGSKDTPTVARIDVTPESRNMTPRALQQLRVIATYSDGSTRDVTRAAAYTTNMAVIADCSATGVIETGKLAGEAAITINYLGKVDVARIVIPQPGTEKSVRPDWFSGQNAIDDFTWAKWEQLRINPSEPCDDATFLRRLFIKTTGTLPLSDQVQAFLADHSPDKRANAIEDALSSKDYINYWTQRWSDIMMVNSETLGGRSAYTFHRWIRQQIEENRPYNEWVYDIIIATGNTGNVGPANFYRSQRTPEDVTKTISQAFLGIRMDCAQCHHHPFEKWAQADFYGLAGYFNGMRRDKLDDNRELVYHPGHQSIAIPVINQSVQTQPLAGNPTVADSKTDPRPELAVWMTSPQNPYFARLVANRIWKHLMGRGLVEPEDDFRETNPPTNPELLDHLSKLLIENEFDLRNLMREILNSHTFQLSSTPTDSNYTDDQAYSHYLVRRLPAEVMLDAICQVTGVPEAYAGHPRGARAIELWDNQLPSYFLDTFGRSLRESPCECGSSGDPTIAQALHLLNAPEIEQKIQAMEGQVTTLTQSSLSKTELIREISLATIGRPPGIKEIKTGNQLLQNRDRRQGIEDFMWVMLNSYDFLFVK
ncbi:MAG: DUF1549 and DUF1553 domain-containing protein [Planctomycetota bacterium]|nr:DUF1549 and DUF1553 domain-containing protein [Planctomycetota bacterium]